MLGHQFVLKLYCVHSVDTDHHFGCRGGFVHGWRFIRCLWVVIFKRLGKLVHGQRLVLGLYRGLMLVRLVKVLNHGCRLVYLNLLVLILFIILHNALMDNHIATLSRYRVATDSHSDSGVQVVSLCLLYLLLDRCEGMLRQEAIWALVLRLFILIWTDWGAISGRSGAW